MELITTDKMLSQFSSLDTKQKSLVIVQLSLELTILARDTYVVASEAVAKPQQLRLYNEIQHILLGQLYKIVTDDEKRYPDNVFLKIIFDMANYKEVHLKLSSLLNKLLEDHMNV